MILEDWPSLLPSGLKVEFIDPEQSVQSTRSVAMENRDKQQLRGACLCADGQPTSQTEGVRICMINDVVHLSQIWVRCEHRLFLPRFSEYFSLNLQSSKHHTSSQPLPTISYQPATGLCTSQVSTPCSSEWGDGRTVITPPPLANICRAADWEKLCLEQWFSICDSRPHLGITYQTFTLWFIIVPNNSCEIGMRWSYGWGSPQHERMYSRVPALGRLRAAGLEADRVSLGLRVSYYSAPLPLWRPGRLTGCSHHKHQEART